ncbi:hypothetical protein O9K51_04598 [Purpureocillium lavendulum]|uniref:Uncharacterized protein n=1 Tax=Purpureocillium lavendulum TaxID=1247861 RepID=A0AB34FX08_9HYPO|nr:hypothetical protein O9K51_04598 [Purpureocillium lavendulum]
MYLCPDWATDPSPPCLSRSLGTLSLVKDKAPPLRARRPAGRIDGILPRPPLGEGLIGAHAERKGRDLVAVDAQPAPPSRHDVSRARTGASAAAAAAADNKRPPPVPRATRLRRVVVEHKGGRVGDQGAQVLLHGGGRDGAGAASRPLDVDVAHVVLGTGQARGVEAAVEVDDEDGLAQRRADERRDERVEQGQAAARDGRRGRLGVAEVARRDAVQVVHSRKGEMTPPCHSFPAAELPAKVQQDARGRRRKLPDGARRVDLSACELFQMLQYRCEVQRPHERGSPVQCFPVERLFRRCSDKKGPFTVETTAWEGESSTPPPPPSQQQQQQHGGRAGDDGPKPAKPFQWSSHWNEADVAPR